MTVEAKWTIAYKSKSYNGGQRFEMDENDYNKYKGDVTIVEDEKPSLERKKTKVVKNKKTK